VVAAEQGAHQSELEAAWAQEEIKCMQMQLEGAERELQRVMGEMMWLAWQKEEADNAARQGALRDYQVHDEGRQEGMWLALVRQYDDGPGGRRPGMRGGARGVRMGFMRGAGPGSRRATRWARGRSGRM
jgi:hypothetical protein